MKLPVVLTPGEDGWVVAKCPLIPGCVSQGKDQREAVANIREAIELCMETQPTEGWSLPPEYQVLDIEVAVAA